MRAIWLEYSLGSLDSQGRKVCMLTMKTLIRLRGWPGTFESLYVAYVKWYVFSSCGSSVFVRNWAVSGSIRTIMYSLSCFKHVQKKTTELWLIVWQFIFRQCTLYKCDSLSGELYVSRNMRKRIFLTCMPNEVSNQLAYPCILITVCMKKLFGFSYPKCAQWRLWSAQDDLNLRWTHMAKGTFSNVAAHRDNRGNLNRCFHPLIKPSARIYRLAPKTLIWLI